MYIIFYTKAKMILLSQLKTQLAYSQKGRWKIIANNEVPNKYQVVMKYTEYL